MTTASSSANSDAADVPFTVAATSGELPRDCDGTLYVNGPFITTPARAPSDATFLLQGAVIAVRLCGGSVRAARVLVRSPSWSREQGRERPLFRSFTAPGSSWFHAMLGRAWNPANLALLPWGAELLAARVEARAAEASTDGFRS
jgi:carotenoid cleavage dioxygenase-like enzyme